MTPKSRFVKIQNPEMLQYMSEYAVKVQALIEEQQFLQAQFQQRLDKMQEAFENREMSEFCKRLTTDLGLYYGASIVGFTESNPGHKVRLSGFDTQYADLGFAVVELSVLPIGAKPEDLGAGPVNLDLDDVIDRLQGGEDK